MIGHLLLVRRKVVGESTIGTQDNQNKQEA